MTPEPDVAASGSEMVETLVLNGLVDVTARGSLLDKQSVSVLETAYREATDERSRRDFESVVNDVAALAPGDRIDEATYNEYIAPVVSAVVEQLSESAVEMTVVHDVSLSVSNREAALYTYATTRSPEALEKLSLPELCGTAIQEGATHAENDAYQQAIDAFSRAVDAATPTSGGVEARTCLALAHHWADEDEAALAAVEDALSVDSDAWVTRAVGLSANHEFAELFREREFGVRVYHRATIENATPASTSVAYREAGSDEEWVTLSGDDDCRPLGRLWPETALRLQVTGSPDSFPSLLGYHVSWGVVNLSDAVARTAEDVFLTGPEGANSREWLRLRRR